METLMPKYVTPWAALFPQKFRSRGKSKAHGKSW